MDARLIDDRLMWNRFVATAATGHICQTYEWAENSGKEAGEGALHIGVLDGDHLVAAMLLTRSHAAGVPAPFFYAPRGPVCDDPQSPALPLLINFARREAKRRGGFLIRSEPNVLQDDEQYATVLAGLGFRPTSHQIYLRGAWVTDIRPSEDDIFANMSTSWRRYIRSGARNGVTTRIGSSEQDFDAFYRLLVETGKRDGFYIYPPELFRSMLVNYSPERAARDGTAEMHIFLAEHEGEVVGAVTVAVLGEWAWYLHGASSAKPEHRKLRPNHVLQWYCMRWAKAHGAGYYDWRTIPDVLEPGEEMYGVYEFKRGFGGYARRVLPTQDLVLRPTLYWPYAAGVSLRRARQKRQSQAHERARRQGADANSGKVEAE